MTERRRRWMVPLVAAALALAVWAPLGTWGDAGSAGTVPRTPPPTWTPRPRTATPRPTAPEPPPTSQGVTSVPEADAWLGLHAAYDVLAPGETVRIELALHSQGGMPLRQTLVTLPWPSNLVLVEARADIGDASRDGARLVWRPGDLAPGESHTLVVEAIGAEDLWPGTQVTLQAAVTWGDTSVHSNQVGLRAPRALLPKTGGG